MTILTREQVLEVFSHPLIQTSLEAKKCCEQLLNHDAALRAEVERLTQVHELNKLVCETKVRELEAQLATAQADAQWAARLYMIERDGFLECFYGHSSEELKEGDPAYQRAKQIAEGYHKQR